MENQQFVSYKQNVLKGNETTWQEIDHTCALTFTRDTYRILLPTGETVTGRMIFEKQENEKMIYKTDAGCAIAISTDTIFFNQYATDDRAFIFFLSNYVEPSFAEKITDNLESEYKFYKERYGELVANCVLERKVVVGLKHTEVLAILGSAKDVWLKRVNDGLEIAITVYEDYYVLFHNNVAVYVAHW